MEVSHLKLLFSGQRDVYMLQQNWTSTKVGVENQQILATVASHGDAGIQRLVLHILTIAFIGLFGRLNWC